SRAGPEAARLDAPDLVPGRPAGRLGRPRRGGGDAVMRIAMVCAHYAPFAGGVESHVEEIARRLVARGENVEVLTHLDDPGRPATQARDGVLVRRHKVPVASQH